MPPDPTPSPTPRPSKTAFHFEQTYEKFHGVMSVAGVWLCKGCGGLVVDRHVHDQHHRTIDETGF